MTEPEMWEAVQRSDASYDGLFFYAVKTTGIFCRPSCKSKPPKRENLCYFASGEEARAAGFRPCKRCRSDLLEYQPMREIAAEIKARLDKASAGKESSILKPILLPSAILQTPSAIPPVDSAHADTALPDAIRFATSFHMNLSVV